MTYIFGTFSHFYKYLIICLYILDWYDFSPLTQAI